MNTLKKNYAGEKKSGIKNVQLYEILENAKLIYVVRNPISVWENRGWGN